MVNMRSRFKTNGAKLKLIEPQELQTAINGYINTLKTSPANGEAVFDYLTSVQNSLQQLAFIIQSMNELYGISAEITKQAGGK
jgi:hypothetical protein